MTDRAATAELQLPWGLSPLASRSESSGGKVGKDVDGVLMMIRAPVLKTTRRKVVM